HLRSHVFAPGRGHTAQLADLNPSFFCKRVRCGSRLSIFESNAYGRPSDLFYEILLGCWNSGGEHGKAAGRIQERNRSGGCEALPGKQVERASLMYDRVD